MRSLCRPKGEQAGAAGVSESVGCTVAFRRGAIGGVGGGESDRPVGSLVNINNVNLTASLAQIVSLPLRGRIHARHSLLPQLLV